MKNKTAYAIKGQIVFNKQKNELCILPNTWLVQEDGKVVGTFETLPEAYANIPQKDYGDAIIIPGLVDLHVHAPQYAFRGMGMDLELLDWLNTYTFPEESKYGAAEYANKAYGMFVEDLKNSATTRACIFATIHTPATLHLMRMLEKSGMHAFVGKVNMDRNSPDYLCETTNGSVAATLDWLSQCDTKNVKPMLTPRFVPSCTDALMRELAKIQAEKNLPVQSHLSENPSEIAWVRELAPKSKNYGDAYARFNLFGNEVPTVMAHCVYCEPAEIESMKARGVYVAHCPQSNTNLASGIAPARTYLDADMHIGLGSDIAGGMSISILRAMSDAVQMSKMRWRYVDDTQKPLTLPEVLYMATKGGGEFFGKVGSFEPDYEFDAVVLDDKNLSHPQELSIANRLERLMNLADDRNICAKYIAGVAVK
ncbi:MAG: amidohydrolase family protein [Ruthenibacterium sp.]